MKSIYKKLMNMTTIKTVNNEEHIVANLPDKRQSAQILSQIKLRLGRTIDYCKRADPSNESVHRLIKRFKLDNVQETSANDSGTSYTVDKGNELHLCLRNKEDKTFHGVNLLMFVALHELAHVMSKSYGHNEEFTKNFVYLLKMSSRCGTYAPVDYSRNSQKFCGIQVNYNPMFNSESSKFFNNPTW